MPSIWAKFSTKPTIDGSSTKIRSNDIRTRGYKSKIAVFAISALALVISRPLLATTQDIRNSSPASVGYSVEQRSVTNFKDDPIAQSIPLDLSQETIRQVIRQLDSERKSFGLGPAASQTPSTRRPGIDGPWRHPPRARAARVVEIRIISIDTRDTATCSALAEHLAGLRPARELTDQPEHLCDGSKREDGHVAQVAIAYPVDTMEFRHQLDTQFLTSTDRNLVNDTRNLAVGMIGTMGVLWAMPGEVTGWDKQAIRANPDGLFAEFKRNIKAGPVWDKDDPLVNYIGHPMAGAAYYTLSRHNGRSPLESFGYSFAMSTFFWEYGFEAFAEIPSIQDLIVTPVIGSLLGEAAFQYEQKIRSQGGTVLGSRTLGKIAMIILNPAGALSDAVNTALGAKIIQNAKADLVLKRYRPLREADSLQSNFVGIQFSFRF